ncbi:2-dehydro-3-deoxygalactonokinase [Massilia sp. Root335]|uniref:2-dehydro-3-deoxygalactonokinase n=1 Tax=Massilia sp. Root335 TaxID=1736517 RepID=UPI0006FEC187|nr:2-dehydro-3-deoxygalactonokinase [Massilia sp. Root335]KQV27068.1 2-dehydro-3-deoxygalactonokinase [Massilia sp. Root335]
MDTCAPTSTRRLLGIDWGTSNRRAYLVDAAGTRLAERADDQGMLAARPDFAGSFARLLAAMDVDADVPVVASGMVGSAQGWRDIPYLDIGVPLEALPDCLVCIDDPRAGRPCLIVPGYAQRGAHVDVMRGEETQLLGAVALGRRDGWFVLPGTHSKWVLVEDGIMRRIATFMTGELFATLSAHGTLAPLMTGDDDDAAFVAGLDEARLGAPLSNALFGVRARVVTGAMPAAQARSFVSGLLVGAEFVAAGRAAPLTCIGSPALQARYARAAGHFGVTLAGLDPDRVYCAALARFLDRIPS